MAFSGRAWEESPLSTIILPTTHFQNMLLWLNVMDGLDNGEESGPWKSSSLHSNSSSDSSSSPSLLGGPRVRLIRESAAWGLWATAERAARLKQGFRDDPSADGADRRPRRRELAVVQGVAED